MLNLKPEEILNYVKSRLNKDKKVKDEINFKNNNILRNCSLYNTLDKFKVNLPLNNSINNLISNQGTRKKGNFNNKKESSEVLTLKQIKFDNNNLKFFHKNYNRIDIDMLKKHLNIKKKKYNKGLDFCSYFLNPRNDYYINVLNEGITNNIISFYAKAKELYTNVQINNNGDVNCNSFKINNLKYPISIMRQLNSKYEVKCENKNKEDKNIYEKCINLLKKEDDNKSTCMNNNDTDKKIFLSGINHNIIYYLENYLENKMKLIDLNSEQNALFEKGHFLKKYNFQFIKKVNASVNTVSIDKSLLISDKKPKYSFNEPRSMFPLFIRGLFDKINVFNLFSFYKNKNIIPNNSDLNFFFEKNIDRPKELNINHFYSEFENSECASNILNGYYLINPLQLSLNNKEFIKKIKISFLPKKLKKDLKSIIGSKFNYNKYRQKRNYSNLLSSQKSQSKKKESEKKIILINSKTAKNYINNPEQYIIIDNDEMDFDILFDINICGKIYYASEFYDQFQYNGFNSVCDLINKNYLFYNKFYIFLIDDEKMHRNVAILKTDKIMNSIYKIIDDKFGFLKNNKYEFNVKIKIVDNPRSINYEINQLYEEFFNNNYNNEMSIYNNKIINRILKEIKDEAVTNVNEGALKININQKIKFNLYEEYIFKVVKDIELKKEIENMINEKYSKLNII